MIRKQLKILTLGVLTATIGAIFLLGNLSITPSSTTISDSNAVGSFLTYHAVVCKKITRADGTVEELGCTKNLFNDDGKRFIAEQVSGINNTATGSAAGNVSVIALANRTGLAGSACVGAQAAAEDFLCGEYNAGCGLVRLRGQGKLNSSAPNAGNWTITQEFTNTCGSADINSTGLFNSTTANDSREIFFAQNTFTTATLATNDKINVTWFIWVV
mgnify:CR=1 FL=1